MNLVNFDKVISGYEENPIELGTERHIDCLARSLKEERLDIASIGMTDVGYIEVDFYDNSIRDAFFQGNFQSLFDVNQLSLCKIQFLMQEFLTVGRSKDFDVFTGHVEQLSIYVWISYLRNDLHIFEQFKMFLRILDDDFELVSSLEDAPPFYREDYYAIRNFVNSVENNKFSADFDAGEYTFFYETKFKQEFIVSLANLHWNRAIEQLDIQNDESQNGAFPLLPYHALAYWKLAEKINGEKYSFEHPLLKPYNEISYEPNIQDENINKVIGMLRDRLKQEGLDLWKADCNQA
jgi:hypothetical protein